MFGVVLLSPDAPLIEASGFGNACLTDFASQSTQNHKHKGNQAERGKQKNILTQLLFFMMLDMGVDQWAPETDQLDAGFKGGACTMVILLMT